MWRRQDNTITVRDLPESTMVHETGHMLDELAISSKGRFASADANSVSREWKSAIESSQAYRALQNAERDPASRIPLSTTRYFLKPHELWARSYEQYIWTKTGDAAMRSQMDAYDQLGVAYWTKEDFEPIEKAMDTLFQTLQWTKKL